MANNVAVAGIAAVALAAFLFIGFFVVDAGIQSSIHDITVTNESFEPTGGQLAVFDNSQLNRATYDDSATVRNATTGETFPESGNYTWFEANGTLEPVTNSDLANASEATVTYDYTGQTLEQTKATNVVVDFMGILPILGFTAFVSFLAIALFALGRWA